jgi:hypothetical protein
MADRTDIPLAEVLREAMASGLLDVHTALPANVVAFDPLARTVDVKPGVRRALEDVDGAVTFEGIPVIYGVPVLCNAGLFPGDRVLLVFSEADAQGWESTGQEADPAELTRHSLNSPFAIPLTSPLVVGNPALADYVALASLVSAQLSALKSAISGAAVAAGDGGAAFKSNLVSALSAWPGPVAATELKSS